MGSTVTDRIAGVSTSVAVKAPVEATTTGNIALAGLGVQAGGTWNAELSAGDRILVKDQSDAKENGIYTVFTSEWRRAKDFDGYRDVVKGTAVALADSGDRYLVSTENPIVIGSSEISFVAHPDDFRVMFVGSVAELEALSSPITGQQAVVSGCPFKYDGVEWLPSSGYVTPEAFGAVGDGVTDDYLAIQAACDFLDGLPTKGGVVHFSKVYGVGTSVAQPDRVYFIGNGSRKAGITWVASDLTNYEKAVVYNVNGTDASPDFVFSTGAYRMFFGANGVAPVAYAIRGQQEGCIYDDLLLSGFTVAGLEALPFPSINHAITFSNIHSIPFASATGAYGMKLSHCQKCVFSNITTDIANPGYYERGIYLYNNPILNVFSAIHTEDCRYGIYQEGGANNIYQGLEANNNQGNGIAHFWTDATRYQINAIRTIQGFTNQLDDGTNVVPATTDTDSINIIRGANYFKRRANFLTGSENLAGFLTRGVYSYAGITGNGQTYLRDNTSIAPSATQYAVIDIGAGDRGFGGKLTVYSTGDQRYAVEVMFAGYVSGTGTVSGGSIGTPSNSGSSAITFGAPEALPSPEPGKFRIPIINGSATFSQILEVKAEISRGGGQVESMVVS